MSDINLISLLESNLLRQLSWVDAVDSKISFVFAISTTMLGVLAVLSPKSLYCWDIVPAISASIALVLGLASLLCLLFASFPRTQGPKNSLIYFGGIVKQDIKQYSAAISKLTQEAYIEDLSAQCHRNAEIANCKMKWIQRSLLALFLSVVPWVLAISFLYKTAQ